MADPLGASPSQSRLEDDEIDLGALVNTLWRGKWFIIFVTMIALLGGGYHAFVAATPIYNATSTVALESREQQVVDFESVVSGLSGDQATINTEIEVMRSRGLAGKLVETLDLTADPEFNPDLLPDEVSLKDWLIDTATHFVPSLAEALPAQEDMPPKTQREIEDRAINRLLERTSVSNIRNSLVFSITARTEDPQKSQLIANTLAELYIRDQVEVKFDATQQATEWLGQRVADLQVELDAAQDELTVFTAEAQIVTPEEIAGLNRQIAELRDRLDVARGRSSDADALTAEVNAAAATQDYEALAALTQDRTLQRLLALPEDSRNPQALAARAAQLATEAGNDRANAQVTALEASLAELEDQIAQQSAGLVQLQELERNVEQARVLFEYFQNRLRETAVQQGIQQADARILSRAVIPSLPSAPRKSRILALAGILGLMAGAGLVLLREMRHSGLRTAEELETLTGMTVMGQLPYVRVRGRKAVLDYLNKKPSSHLAEAFRNLRTSVMLSDLDKPPQIIMSTSSVPGEGKTIQSLAMANNFAGLGKSVLLIEGDIRRRVFRTILDFKDEKGLLAVLSGDAGLEEVVQQNPDLGAVDVLIADREIKTNPVDVFSSDRFAEFLNKARGAYDVIIIDTPPVLAVPDARVIGQSCDAVLYAVKWDSTPRSAIREGLRLLETVNVKIAGLVLTQINQKRMEQYGYGTYRKYGKGYYTN